MLDISAFGSIEVAVGGRSIRLSSEQALTVAVLVAAGPSGLTRSELYGHLYPSGRQKSGEQAAVMRVRRLRDRLERDSGIAGALNVQDRFGFNPSCCTVDVWRFQHQWTSDNPDVLLRLAEDWAEPYDGLTDEVDVVMASRNELRTQYQQTMIRFGWMIERSFGAEAAGRLESLVADDPFNEHLVASTAAALYRLGRQIDATRLIGTCRRRLLDEFGLNPGPHLDDIELAILNQDSERLASRRPSSAAPMHSGTSLVDDFAEPDRFVGRQHLLDALCADILQRPERGSPAHPGQIHLLIGPAGMGKTTLVRRVLSGLDPADFNRRLGRARAARIGDGGAPGRRRDTYGPIVDALPELESSLPPAGRGTADGSGAGDGEAGRIRFWQETHAHLQEMATSTPTVIVFEDIHDADTPTVDLLRYLVTSARPSNLTIILTARSDVLDPEQRSGPMSDIVTSDSVQVTEVPPITLNDLRALVALDHPDEPVVKREAFTQRVWDLSQGHVMVASILSRDAPSGLDPLRLPDSLEWEGALATLLLEKARDPDLRQLLSTAALLAGTGLEFNARDLADILGLDDQTTVSLLEQARKEDLCFPVGRDLWTFDHLLTLGLFDQQLGVLRPMLCAQLAHVDPITSTDRVRYMLGAGHLIPADEVIETLLADAEQLIDRLAFREAISALEAVLLRIGATDGRVESSEHRLEVLILLASCHARIGDFDGAAEYRGAAFDLARSLDDPVAMYRVATAGLPSGEYAGGDRDRHDMLEAIEVERLPVELRPDLFRWRIRLARLLDHSQLALDVVESIDWEEIGDRRPSWADFEAEVLILRQASEGRLVHDDLVALTADFEAGPRRAALLLRIALAALIEQRTDALDNAIPRAMSEIRLHGSPRLRWEFDMMMAALSEVGMVAPGLPTADPESARLSGLRWAIPDVYDAWGVQIWANRWFTGQFEEALALLDAGQTATFDNVAWTAAEAMAAAKVGADDRARTKARSASRKLVENPANSWAPTAAALVVESAVELGDPDLIEAAVTVLEPRSGRAVVLGIGSAYLGPVDRYLGLAASLTDRQAARELLLRAHEQTARTGATHWHHCIGEELDQLV